MKNILNKISIWLYLKTRETDIKTHHQIFSGMKVFKNDYIPKDTCYIGTGEADLLKKSFLDKEINLKKL